MLQSGKAVVGGKCCNHSLGRWGSGRGRHRPSGSHHGRCRSWQVNRRRAELDCPFLDADDFHPAEDKEKMRNGIPLSECNRWPWQEKLRQAMEDYINNGKTVVLPCSALRRTYYRNVLRAEAAANTTGKVVFVHLKGSYELFASRQKEGSHPGSLLQSQLDLLEEDDEMSTESSYFINVDAIVLRPLVKHGLPARHNVDETCRYYRVAMSHFLQTLQ